MSKRWNSGFYFLLAAVTAMSLIVWWKFAQHIFALITYPFDWEPTDGDQINMTLRILHGLPIYTDWKSGSVLSDYTPGYNYLLALLSPVVAPGMEIGRIVSLLAFMGCVFLIYLVLARKGSDTIGQRLIPLVMALSVVLIYWERALTDLIHVLPNTLYSFLGLASLFVLGVWEQRRNSFILFLSALLAVLAVMTKQQGLFAAATGFAFLAWRRPPLKDWLIYGLSFMVLTVAAVLYIESINNHNFLNSTFLNIGKVIEGSYPIARERLRWFYFQNLPWTCLVMLGFWMGWKRKMFSVWQVSVIVQSVLLLKILGNEGGGPNYLLPLWCTLLICSGETLLTLKEMRHDLPVTKWKPWALALGIVLLCNSAFGVWRNYNLLRQFQVDKATLVPIMQSYYSNVAELVHASDNKKAFVARNEGAWIMAGADVTTEFSLFKSAWESKKKLLIDKSAVFEQMRKKEFAFVVTGVQPIPTGLMPVILESYQLAKTVKANLWRGNIGDVQIYTPK